MSPDTGPSEVPQQATDEFVTTDSLDEARELIFDLEEEDTMLKYVVQGDGLIAGNCDVIRPYDSHEHEIQVDVQTIGRVHWISKEDAAREVHEKQLPYKIVEWEARSS